MTARVGMAVALMMALAIGHIKEGKPEEDAVSCFGVAAQGRIRVSRSKSSRTIQTVKVSIENNFSGKGLPENLP